MTFARRGSVRSLLLVLALLAVILLSRCDGPGSSDDEQDPRFAPGGELPARVTGVVDGDTIEVLLPDGAEEDVRYIGIDTPESVKPDSPVECGGPRAGKVNERLVGGRLVLLKFDAEERDRYGRLLAYVYLPHAQGGSEGAGRDLLVNAELVRRGLARTLEIEPNTALAELFAGLQTAAARAGRGLWGNCGWR
jgi:micrococcal nuclease